jgi:hypothetical protein
MLGRSPAVVATAEKVKLDREEHRLAGRLAILTGKRRDDVLAEAYRRADRILTEKRP